MLRPEYAGQPAAEARFRREATTAARLRHPNIVFIRDVGEAEGTVFVAMDLLPLSLARRLEVFPRLPETEVVRFALEVAAALSIAHADGVVHRDIKPDNVMLGQSGEAIVADFGLAGAFAKSPEAGPFDGDDPGKVMGTPHYFSPEQARGFDLDGRSDLYSLGVMCYRAATGTLPFEGDDWTSVARQHVEDAPVPPRMLVPELTEGFEAIVLRLMAKKPEQRFSTATQLADALLTLPTAPASLAVGLTPSSASITQVSLPYLYNAVTSGRSWKRMALFGALAVAVIAGAAYFVNPPSDGIRNVFVSAAEPSVTTPVNLDSVPGAGDSVVAPPPTVVDPAPVVAKPPVRAAGTARASAPITKTVVTVLSSEPAVITIDDTIKVFGSSWTGPLTAGKQHPHNFRARLENEPKGCKSADQEQTVAFFAATGTVELDVGHCTVLLLTVENTSNSEFTVISRSGWPSRNDKINNVPKPIVLRDGNYELQLTAEKCSDYSNKNLVVSRDSTFGSDTLRKTIRMECGKPGPP